MAWDSKTFLFRRSRLFFGYAFLTAIGPLHTASAHEDPPGCFETAASVIVNVFRADGTTGVSGNISQCETVNYRARLQKAQDSDEICAFSGGTFTLTTPDGVVHVVSADVPCVGGTSGEGCDSTVDSVQSALIPYKVTPKDVVHGLITANTSYTGGVSHDSLDNTPGIAAISPKASPVVFCTDNDLCNIDSCDPAMAGSAACSSTPIVCDDANLCTLDHCDPASGVCIFEPTAPCTDGNLCTSDSCNPATGTCVFMPTVFCNDNNACTSDSCNPFTGTCIFDDDGEQLCDDHNPCTSDTCQPPQGTCDHVSLNETFPACGSCGDGIVGNGEQCDAGMANGSLSSCCTSTCRFRALTEVCRPQAGDCDAAETCSGASGDCPIEDKKRAVGTGCLDDLNVCTADTCDGVQNECQHTPGNAGTQCRASRGTCDAVDVCDGVSPGCEDARMPSHTPCSSDGNLCTTDECNGQSILCGHVPLPDDTVCRPSKPSSFGCDAEERCKGGVCPPDLPAPIRTPCSNSDGLVCTDEQCDGSGTCRSVTLPRFTPCGESDFCDGTVCRHLESNTCGIQDPPKTDDGEDCDDGVTNDTLGSCCTFQCKFKDKGRECATATVPQGVCNGKGSCVGVGECGNAIREDVAFVDGTAIHEDCDLGDLNGADRNQGSCCDKSCKVQDGAFICQVPPNSCLQNSTCGSASSQLPEPGECPPPLPAAKGTPCFVACQLGQGGLSGCTDGQCQGDSICGVDLIRKSGKVPRFALGCRARSAPGVTGSATCVVDQVAVPLGSVLSAAGLDLVRGSASSIRVGSNAAPLSDSCGRLADSVRDQCDVANERAFCCARASVRANRRPEKCKRTDCYRALLALAKGCPDAVGDQSQTLEVALVAKVTGLTFQGQATDQDLSGSSSCPKKGKCK